MKGDTVRLDCLAKEKMQCHSHTIGHLRRHSEIRLPGKRERAVSQFTHILLVMVRLDCLATEKMPCHVTHILLGHMVKLDCQENEKGQCHSHPIGHGRRNMVRLDCLAKEQKCIVTYFLLVMEGDMVTRLPGK
jgi:hypothetical protein